MGTFHVSVLARSERKTGDKPIISQLQLRIRSSATKLMFTLFGFRSNWQQFVTNELAETINELINSQRILTQSFAQRNLIVRFKAVPDLVVPHPVSVKRTRNDVFFYQFPCQDSI